MPRLRAEATPPSDAGMRIDAADSKSTEGRVTSSDKICAFRAAFDRQ